MPAGRHTSRYSSASSGPRTSVSNRLPAGRHTSRYSSASSAPRTSVSNRLPADRHSSRYSSCHCNPSHQHQSHGSLHDLVQTHRGARVNTPNVPVANVIPNSTPNALMAKTSSTLAAAVTSVGIPLSTPRPRKKRLTMLGTTTAGDTAPSTDLQDDDTTLSCNFKFVTPPQFVHKRACKLFNRRWRDSPDHESPDPRRSPDIGVTHPSMSPQTQGKPSRKCDSPEHEAPDPGEAQQDV